MSANRPPPIGRAFACLSSMLLLSGLLACEDEPEAPPPSAPVPETYVARGEEELRGAIQAALARARETDRKVLLDFGADWCPDCREVLRVAHQPPAKDVLASDYETVVIDVGRFDRHHDLLERYRIERIATLVVLDAQGDRIAQTTLEPISSDIRLTPGELAEWLRDPRDQWRPPEGQPVPPEPERPVMPPEVVEGE